MNPCQQVHECAFSDPVSPTYREGCTEWNRKGYVLQNGQAIVGKRKGSKFDFPLNLASEGEPRRRSDFEGMILLIPE